MNDVVLLYVLTVACMCLALIGIGELYIYCCKRLIRRRAAALVTAAQEVRR